MKDLSGLIADLKALALNAHEAAEALERLQTAQHTDVRWTMTVEEAADALDINVSTVYEYVKQRQFPHVKVGKRILIPRLAILRWLETAAEQARAV
jgi:excisionase family DNA binding protein